MLLLTYLLRNSHDWNGAVVRMITVVNDEASAQQVGLDLQKVLDQARSGAQAHVVLRKERTIAQVMEAESRQTDLAIMGLKLPEEGEEARPFLERMEAFLEALPTTLLVCSARDFEGEPVLFDD